MLQCFFELLRCVLLPDPRRVVLSLPRPLKLRELADDLEFPRPVPVVLLSLILLLEVLLPTLLVLSHGDTALLVLAEFPAVDDEAPPLGMTCFRGLGTSFGALRAASDIRRAAPGSFAAPFPLPPDTKRSSTSTAESGSMLSLSRSACMAGPNSARSVCREVPSTDDTGGNTASGDMLSLARRSALASVRRAFSSVRAEICSRLRCRESFAACRLRRRRTSFFESVLGRDMFSKFCRWRCQRPIRIAWVVDHCKWWKGRRAMTVSCFGEIAWH